VAKSEASQAIQILVNEANGYIKNNKLKQAKHKYLDACETALRYAKDVKTKRLDKLSYEQLAKILISYARDLQSELDLLDLPTPPGMKEKPKPAIKKPDEEETKVEEEIKDLEEEIRPEIVKIVEVPSKPYQLFIIQLGGVPIVSHEFKFIEDVSKGKLNEILFSGALTAINQLMLEVINKPIQHITLDGSILLIRQIKDVSYVLFADKISEKLEDQLRNFAERIEVQFGETFHKGLIPEDYTHDERIQALINEIFI
jgi:hypothetical protein